MQIKWISNYIDSDIGLGLVRISGYFEGTSNNTKFYIALDFDNDTGCITCCFPDYRVFIPFTFSQIPGEQNDPDLLALAHQLIEKEIQKLKDNGRY